MRPVTLAVAPTSSTVSDHHPRPSIRDQFHDAFDLRGFVERHRTGLHDPETAYYVSQVLEECAVTQHVNQGAGTTEMERAAARELAARCRGFEGEPIQPGAILAMLHYAARWGEPHAAARLLLMRDVAAPKDEVLPQLAWMLSSREPAIVRDVGAFLSRGEAQWRYGSEQVPPAVAAIAWELAACDLDRACDPWSRFALAQCAFLGRCAAGRYEDAVALFEPPELMAQAHALRPGILRALRDGDWEWLGLR